MRFVIAMMGKYVFWTVVMIPFLWTGCTFTRKVQTGLQAFEVKQYALAVQLFENEYAASRAAGEQARIAFLTGESFTQLHDPVSAASWYFKAHQDGYGAQALERYAAAMKQQEKYPEAIMAYEDLLKTSPGNALYRSNITLCRQAMDWKKNSSPAYEITPVTFNSTASDYSPQPIGPGMVLFSSDRDHEKSKETYLWTGRAFSDLFIADGATKTVIPFDSKLNTQDNEGTAIISPDGSFVIFTRCFSDQSYDAWCKLLISYRRGNSWSDPEALPFTRDKINYGHPALAANGTTLFFSSDAPEGQGGHDLYFSQQDGTGGWTTPVNLGPIINTIGEEQYPTLYKDTLYFSSDHLAGLGGLDIFKTYLDASGRWVPPVNLRAPVNGGADDFGLVVDTFTTLPYGILMQGYFTSSRGGMSRLDDIYSFAIKGELPGVVVEEPVGTEEEVKAPADYQLFLALSVVEPTFEIKDDPNSGKTGSKPLPHGPVIIQVDRNDERRVTDANGQLLLKLEWNKQYILTARYRDHLAASDTIVTQMITRDPDKPITTLSRTLVLEPLIRNKEIELQNIFYDYDQWAIREDARPSLNALTAILKTNPSIRIQLASYTDCRGTEEYNIELSRKRAQAAVDYLIAQGIAADRLAAQGFGETSLAVPCICEQCTEAEHQANRRTTFKILD